MSSSNATDLVDIDRRYSFHPFSNLATHEKVGPHTMMVRGQGVWLEDAQGRRYLDGMAGLWCVNVGYGRTELAEAMRRAGREAAVLPRVLVVGRAISRRCSRSA